MRFFKYLLLVFSILLFTFAFSACLNETHTVSISSNGGRIVHEQVIKEDVYNQIVEMGGDLEQVKDEGYEVIFYTENDEKYVKAIKTYEFGNLIDLERYFEELATSDEGADSEKYFTSFDIKSKGDKIILTGEIGKPNAASTYTSCDVILKFQGKIHKHTIGEKKDDKTLVLNLVNLWDNNSGEEFEIIAGGFNYFILVICAAVLLLILIVTFIFVKIETRKKYVYEEEIII